MDNVDLSFGEKDRGDFPPAKKRKGKKGKASSRQSVDDSPSPFADSSVVFEDSPAPIVSDNPDADLFEYDSCPVDE